MSSVGIGKSESKLEKSGSGNEERRRKKAHCPGRDRPQMPAGGWSFQRLSSLDPGDPSSDPSSSSSGSESDDSMDRRNIRESTPMPMDRKNTPADREEKE